MAAAEGASRTAAELAEQRQTWLLGGTDEQIDTADRALASANREVDRAEAAIAALEVRLGAAEEAERGAALDRLFQAGQDALDRGIAIYREYEPAAAALAERIAELPNLAEAIEQTNRQLLQRGDPRRVNLLDETARPRISDLQSQLRVPLWQGLRLPSSARPFDSIWPERKETVIRAPVRPPAEEGAEPPPPLRTRAYGIAE